MKAALRSRTRSLLEQISMDARKKASASACEILRRQTVWESASTILFYSALADELDISSLWMAASGEGKRFMLPRFCRQQNGYEICEINPLERSLRPGHFGILEPDAASPVVSLKQLDLALVPGVAFDTVGRRLGRGRGFYDRILKDVSGFKCGVAFDQQIASEIPVEPHDIRVDCILTPTRWLEAPNAGL
jgi:5-formyltetrahydrofolate cyclo-ligase